MIKLLKKLLKPFLSPVLVAKLAEIKNRFFDGYATKSYSQEGEDMILKRLLEGQETGFYIDVGAHHPQRFSNTYFFYKMGWRGINIDAMPGSMTSFKRLRPRDINIEKPVSDQKQTLTYYAFNEPALNSFSKELADVYISKGFRLIFQKKLETSTLEEILNANLPENQTIDFLSVDVEGLDLKVLHSNNWDRYSPKFVLVEILNSSFAELDKSELAVFMKSKGYQLHAKSENTVFFKKTVHN